MRLSFKRIILISCVYFIVYLMLYIKQYKVQPKLILFWGPIKYFSSKYLEKCNYPCRSSMDKSLIKQADAIVIHGWNLDKKLPDYRSAKQRWVFLLNESPKNYKNFWKDFESKDFNGVFNWTMTYKRDSDIRLLMWVFKERKERPKDSIDIYKGKQKFALAVISNCKNKERLDLVREIQNYSSNRVDFFGKCGDSCKNKCNVTFKDYKFYLSFENSFYCKDYITEKFFRNGILAQAIPVVKGARKENYFNLNTPNDSFLYVDDFKSIKELVDYMLKLDADHQEFNKHHKWRETFYLKENYIGHWCELCNKLHEDKTEKFFEKFDELYNSCENYFF
jgi:hypothetical protein